MFKTIGIACLISMAAVSTTFAVPSGSVVTRFCDNHPALGKKAASCMLKAPEIDPSSAIAGLTLLAGGVAVMLGRRSKRLQTQAE